MELTLRQMDLWYQTPLGSCLLEAERAALAPYFENCFRQNVLQLGGPGEILLSEPHPDFYLTRLSPESVSIFKAPSVRGSFDALPFFPDSMQLILLPHVLEFSSHPEKILAQCDITLSPEGRMIILSFNPWSLWGIYKYCRHPKTFPWRARFLSTGRLKKLVQQQGLVIDEMHTLFFRPPIQNEKKLAYWKVLEGLGPLFWSDAGAVNLIVARKQVVPLIPIQGVLKYA